MLNENKSVLIFSFPVSFIAEYKYSFRFFTLLLIDFSLAANLSFSAFTPAISDSIDLISFAILTALSSISSDMLSSASLIISSVTSGLSANSKILL